MIPELRPVATRINEYLPPGHVDAGKSTLMGRLLYELGLIDERKRIANERASDKAGKGSFKWAWEP